MKIIRYCIFSCMMYLGLGLKGQNVQISNLYHPTEPSIMMNPLDPSIIVAASNLNMYYFSSDTGKTWGIRKLSSSFGVWGDPVIDVDTAGHFYFTHLSNPSSGNWIDRIVCQKSDDSGRTWSDGSYAGLNGAKVQDKQWTVVDRKNNTIYMTWTQFDKYASSEGTDSSVIQFTKSIDGGVTWTPAKRISPKAGDCFDEDNTVEGATPAIGPDGELYVAWAGPDGIVMNRSLDHGDTWLSKEISINPMHDGWNYDIPGLLRCNGLPILKCDLSGGPNHGTLYVNWTDQSKGVDNTENWLSKSSDGGDTWTEATLVNNDTTNRHQFLTWMDIDQTNGNLYFVFYDRRNYADNNTDVYLAISRDGGNNFINKRISESSFVPNNGIFFGDYNNITVHNNIVRPIWTRLHNGQLSIWTDVSPLEKHLVSIDNHVEQGLDNVQQFPNPVSDGVSYVSFKLRNFSTVSLELQDNQGVIVHTVFTNRKMSYGKYVIPIQLDELNLASGVYFHKLTINNTSRTIKTVLTD